MLSTSMGTGENCTTPTKMNKCLSLQQERRQYTHGLNMNRKENRRRTKDVPSEAVHVVISQPEEVYRRSAIPCSKLSTASTELNATCISQDPPAGWRIPRVLSRMLVAVLLCVELAASRTSCSVALCGWGRALSTAAVGAIRVTGRADSGRKRRPFPDGR
jgi:hypothetical protein